jgi:GT2 family glycosyltransferase
VIIGCPVNRARVLPKYLKALRDLDYPDKAFLFLENDSTDSTLPILLQFASEWGARAVSESFPGPAYNRNEFKRDSYTRLAAVRNRLIDLFLESDADYLFSVDSDVIVPPDILTRLLAIADPETIAGAAICNVAGCQLDGTVAGNFMIRKGNLFDHPKNYPLSGVMDVDHLGACYLIPRSVLEGGVRYAADMQGEDAPWCRAAAEKGYRMQILLDSGCDHRMNEVV